MPYFFDRFPLEGYPFFVERQWGLNKIGDVLLFILFVVIAVALLSCVWAAKKGRWQRLRFLPRSRLSRQVFLVCTYLCSAMGFGFLYHGMFQYNPDHFKINPTSGDVRLLDAISEHQKALENLRNAEQVVIATVAGLRSEVGRQSLTDFADALPDDEVRTTFVSCLSLAVVGPPRRLTPQQIKQLERIQGTPGLAEELKKAEEEVAKTSPEFLMPVPYWPRVRELQRYQPYNMKAMIEKWLEPIQAKQSGSLKDYATEEDTVAVLCTKARTYFETQFWCYGHIASVKQSVQISS